MSSGKPCSSSARARAFAAALEVLAAVWGRGNGGVSDDSDTPVQHVVRSEVPDCLGERLRRRLDHLAERQRKQVLRVAVGMRDPIAGQQAFEERVAARTTVAIGHDLGQ
jgi:hypothetical protein